MRISLSLSNQVIYISPIIVDLTPDAAGTVGSIRVLISSLTEVKIVVTDVDVVLTARSAEDHSAQK